MAKQRVTEQMAKNLVDEFCKTGDLDVFLVCFGDYAYRFGRYGPYPRQLFQDAIRVELKKNLSHALFDKIICRIAEKEFEK